MNDQEVDDMYPEIDDKQTIKNARDFFTHKLPRFQRMSGWQLKESLRSPVFDGMPKGQSNQNGAEKALLDRLEQLDEEADGHLVNAGRIVLATVEAIKQCDPTMRTMLIGTYVLHQSQTYIMTHSGYEESQYRVKKREAYLQFADYFERTRRECHAGYPSLLAYEDRRSIVG
ncbi:ArpU family phage packaging/lysis transcriptional regulator [Furfurilactobacillus sp. WILCCON 0119]|uniref:ArpU family phage packaging/lysis transcriptional regulator n=1 Tax=Furfurilactobacillus entadae TaxID=2922307 RepID=UPI0035E8235A